MSIEVVYHLEEEGSWWAESPNLEGFTAAAEIFEDLRKIVQEAAEEAFGHVPDMNERFEITRTNVPGNAFSVRPAPSSGGLPTTTRPPGWYSHAEGTEPAMPSPLSRQQPA